MFTIRRYQIDEPSVRVISRKEGDVERSILKFSDQEAFNNYFAEIKKAPNFPTVKSIIFENDNFKGLPLSE